MKAENARLRLQLHPNGAENGGKTPSGERRRATARIIGDVRETSVTQWKMCLDGPEHWIQDIRL
ncbi:hypothetical protein EYF80_009860 [Liparis tanakae]|uniref:Uncharacterized protein n=1 Tax=Liparis tanakae TaxID=230148 RepID=A0A4Z2IRK4_9TELE|nr:hypothetical protein EYF80_009860 [Liparis tanakae]